MRFSTAAFSVLAAAAALVGFALAEGATTESANPISVPLGSHVAQAGKEFTIEWSPTAGDKVTLVLRKGKPGTLDTLQIIAEDYANNGAFIWTPSPDLEGGSDYAIQILSEEPLTSNYSPQFKIDSNGKGISSTIKPTATKAVAASLTKKPTATYTGDKAKPTAENDLEAIEDEDSGAAPTNGGLTNIAVAAIFGVLAGSMLVLV